MLDGMVGPDSSVVTYLGGGGGGSAGWCRGGGGPRDLFVSVPSGQFVSPTPTLKRHRLTRVAVVVLWLSSE